MKPFGLVRAGCSLMLLIAGVACSPEKDKNPLYDVPLADPINAFSPDSKETDAATMSTDSMSSTLECAVPTTEQRLQGPLTGANYRFVKRTIHFIDVPRSVRDEEIGYSTEGSSGRFTKSYKLNQLSVRGESALGGIPLAYVDQCTASGCDERQRRYTSGSPLYKFDVEAKANTMQRRDSYLPQTSCAHRTDYSPARSTVQRGVVHLDGVNYRAVKFTTRQSGRITCESGSIQSPPTPGKTVDMGTGDSVQIEIVLADKLPVSNIPLPLYNTARACERTTVYQASFYMQGDRIIVGNATDVANAKLSGRIMGVAEFRAAKQARLDLVKRLNDALVIAQSEKREAELKAARYNVEFREAKNKEAAALAEATRLEQIGYRAGSTQAEREAALTARTAATEATDNAKRAEDLMKSQNELVTLANRRLAEAEAALRKAEQEARN
jgi:hypothetical protein